MDCLPYTYAVNIILFILFNVCIYMLFMKSLESIFIIILFVLTVFASFNIIVNLINTKSTLDLSKLSEFFSGNNSESGNILNLITSDVTLIIISIILIINTILYTKGGSSWGVTCSTIVLASIIALRSGEILGEIPLWLVFAIPILFTVIAFIIVLTSMTNISQGNFAQIQSLSDISTSIEPFKFFASLLLYIFMLFFLVFFIFYDYTSKDNAINKLLQKSVFFISPILYILSGYLIYLSSKTLSVKIIQ